MIQSKNLQFSYNDIDFEATVTFNDLSFRNVRSSETSIFYDVKLTKPEMLECGGEVLNITGIMSLMLFLKKTPDRHYIYKEDMDLVKEGDNINVYPKAIAKIIYAYFNKEKITHYRQKIKKFNDAVENKYALTLSVLREEKLALRKQVRSGEIDSKVYQKHYTPIRLKKEEIELKIFRVKDNYKRRYFECCELKHHYRTVLPQKKISCNDSGPYKICGLTKFLAKTKIVVEDKKQT